jgi:hypothetical protein
MGKKLEQNHAREWLVLPMEMHSINQFTQIKQQEDSLWPMEQTKWQKLE